MIEAKWAEAGVSPAAPASDAEFLRRLSLDLTGAIPAADEVRRFLEDRSADKRAALIDRLLAAPAFSRRMADAFDLMLMERRTGDDAASQAWNDFLRDSFAENVPLDRLARQILAPDAEDPKARAAAVFYTKRLESIGANPVDYPRLARDVGRLFLGQDLQCAQCHNHLQIKQYKQADFQGLFAFVGQTYIRKDAKFPAVGEKVLDKKIEFTSVFAVEPKKTGPRIPGGVEIAIPSFPKGQEYLLPPDKRAGFLGRPKFSPLQSLGEQVPQSNLFSRNMANRLWFLVMGRGLVHPLDLDHGGNPPSHPELLDLLTDQLKAMKYDSRAFLRELLLTKTYQRSSLLPSGAEPPANLFAVAPLRRLSAEQLTAMVLTATGELERVAAAKAAPKVEKKIDPAADVNDDEKGLASKSTGPVTLREARKKFVSAFAAPMGEAEIDFSPSLAAALFLSNSDVILDWLKPRQGNLVDRLGAMADSKSVADELYLSVLTRLPTDDERAEVGAFLEKNKSRRMGALSDLAWALLASTEFCVNH